uniref:USP domain-containing protein n=1 Tax=Dicentrarchus labrax TaxID=13489 RepID=A0A8P4KEZ0_DICLA
MGDEEDSNPRKRCRDEITKADEEEQTAAKKPCVTTSEGLTDDAAERHETSNVDKLGEEQLTRKEEESISEEDEGEMRKDQERDTLSLQAREEEGETESVNEDTSVRETINDRNINTGVKCATLSKVKTGDKEVQETLFMNEDSTRSSSTEENTNDKSEELKETKVDDAPVNVEEQVKHSSDQHLDKETKTEKQKQTECQKPAETNSEDLTDKVKEEQGEDIGLEEQKGEELENENVSKRDTDDEENTQIGHSEEDDGQMGKDQEKDTLSLQAGGEEGDEESVKKDTSVRETSYYRNTNSDEDCEKQKLLNSEDEEVQENLKSIDDAPVNVGKQKRSSKKTNTVKQKQRAIQPQRVHYGLHNQGATCYLNSVLQVLFMTPEVHDRFHSELETELNRVFAGLKKRTCGTENITRILKIKNVYEQGDAAECLELILNKISQQDSKEIQGRLMYTTKCSEGHIINKETSLFWTLPLSLPLSLKDNHDTTYSVERSFERIFQTKIFNGDNKVHCNECNYKTEATKECEMEKYPPILTVLLKRFDFDYRRMSHFKSDCCVDVPLELKRKNQTYKLYGMVKHMGSLTGGHYTATILSDEDETWYECSDTYVRKVEQLFEKETYKSRTVYLLMYRECQKPVETNSEDLTDKVKEEQGEDIGLEEQKGEELENKNVSKRDTDDEENTQIGHSEEDDGQMGKDQEKDTLSLQAGGEEGDEESVKKDTSENTNEKSEELKETKVDDAPVNVEEQVKHSSDQHLDKETKTEKQKQTECQKPVETNSEDLTDKVKEEQGEVIGLEEQKGEELENKNVCKRDTDDEDNTQMGHSEEDEGQMRKDQEKHALSLQARGEEGDEESVKKDTSVRETINDRHMSTDEDCEKQNKLINSEDEVVQETLFVNEDNTHSSSTEENTNDKSEELKETKVDDAPVNVGEQLNNSSEQHLNEETKTEKQKQTECQKPAETNSEDLTDKVKEEQGEDIGLEEQKGEEGENNNVSKRDTDDEDNTQMGHSEEDALGLQARGEEGDAESIKKDTSVRETSCYRNTKSDEDREKQKLLNSEDEIQENLNSMGSTHGGKSVSQGETERGSPCCNIWSSLPNFLCFKRSSTAET